MARDLGEHRIRVNTVVPGWIMTERQKELWATPEALEKHLQRQCLPDLIEPVYVARMGGVPGVGRCRCLHRQQLLRRSRIHLIRTWERRHVPVCLGHFAAGSGL